jgi:hypothetical protein
MPLEPTKHLNGRIWPPGGFGQSKRQTRWQSHRIARATDKAGRVQPEKAEWNRLGYGNNSIQEVAIRVV